MFCGFCISWLLSFLGLHVSARVCVSVFVPVWMVLVSAQCVCVFGYVFLRGYIYRERQLSFVGIIVIELFCSAQPLLWKSSSLGVVDTKPRRSICESNFISQRIICGQNELCVWEFIDLIDRLGNVLVGSLCCFFLNPVIVRSFEALYCKKLQPLTHSLVLFFMGTGTYVYVCVSVSVVLL